MTQKEYISQLLNINIPYETTVGEYIRTLEQRIAELEEDVRQRECLEIDATTIRSLRECITELETPKTCEGCCWYVSELCTHWSSRQEDCCSRMVQLTDFYNGKDIE